jgi:hypothetical protein
MMEDAMAERELIDTGTDKRYVRRDKDGTFKESDDVSRSLSADARQKAKNEKPKNEGDRGGLSALSLEHHLPIGEGITNLFSGIELTSFLEIALDCSFATMRILADSVVNRDDARNSLSSAAPFFRDIGSVKDLSI